MKTIDLHTHSDFSDGSEKPENLINLAAKAGLSAFALTDHDTVDGFTRLFKAASAYNAGLCRDEQIEVLPGVEISAAYKEGDIHILGLLVDPYDTDFNDILKTAERERKERNIKMVQNLIQAGIPISYDEIVDANPDAVITRAHFGKFLVDKGITADYTTAFEKYLGDDTPYYVARKFIHPEDAIKGILRAGGIPVLAHPMIYRLPRIELEALVDELIGYGLKGIETFYSSHTNLDEAYIRGLARKKGLIMTGGSDFHGEPKPFVKMGVGKGNLRIPYKILEQLREEQFLLG